MIADPNWPDKNAKCYFKGNPATILVPGKRCSSQISLSTSSAITVSECAALARKENNCAPSNYAFEYWYSSSSLYQYCRCCTSDPLVNSYSSSNYNIYQTIKSSNELNSFKM